MQTFTIFIYKKTKVVRVLLQPRLESRLIALSKTAECTPKQTTAPCKQLVIIL